MNPTLPRMPHDEFVKRMMSNLTVARDFFEAHLSSTVQSRINLDTLLIEHTSFVDEQLKGRESDMLYRVQLLSGESAFLYLLVEHQSTSDPLIAFRLAYYIFQLLDRHVRQCKSQSPLPLPLVFPLVFYNGKEAFTANRDLFSLFGDESALAQDIFLKPFDLVDVSTIEDYSLRKHRWAGILEWCSRHAIERDFLPYVEVLAQLLRILDVQTGDMRLTPVLNYMVLGVETPEETKKMMELLRDKMPNELRRDVMTLGEKLYSEGWEEGREESLEKTLEALDLLKQGVEFNEIVTSTGLSLSAVKQLSHRITIVA